jgi:hypothetical protein
VSVEFSSNWSQILRTLSPSPLCLNWSWVHSISGLVMSTTATAHACVAPHRLQLIPSPAHCHPAENRGQQCRAHVVFLQFRDCPIAARRRNDQLQTPPIMLIHMALAAVTTTAPHQWRQSGFVQKQKRIMWLVSWEEKRPKSWSVTTTAPHQWRQSGFVQKQKRIMSLVSWEEKRPKSWLKLMPTTNFNSGLANADPDEQNLSFQWSSRGRAGQV